MRGKLVLADYIVRNLVARFGLRPHVREEVSVSLGGIQVTIRPHQGELYLYKEIFVDQVYERHPAFRLRPGWCVVDAGANIGMFALKASCRHGCAQTYAFEPNRETFARLLTNLERNHATSVKPLCKAVGRASRWARLETASASTTSRLISAQDEKAPAEAAVEVVPLSTFIEQEQVPVIHFLKLDVEGAEAEVLHGAEPVLNRIERIAMEYHSPDLLQACERVLGRCHFRKVLEVSPSYAYFLRASVAS